jgi:predicted glycogen debranching enzyme
MREWIITNGLGGYASLNFNNINTRKYHGLLIASLNPPTKRWIFVSNAFDQILINGDKFDLKNFKNKYSYDVFPSFSYELNDIIVKKTIFMENEKNTTIIRYKIDTEKPLTIFHNPIVNSRHFYDVNGQRYLSFQHEISKNSLFIKPSNIDKTLKIFLKDAEFKPLHYWEEFYYNKDRERNESWIDNNVHIGRFEKKIDKSCDYYIIFTIEDDIKINPLQVYNKETKRKKDLLLSADLPIKCNKLVSSTDNFIVQKNNSKSIIAGYHWFGDWGRDALIALPGLTLVTKRFEDAKQILLTFSKHCKNGLIPNAFIDKDSKAVFNTVDASLWYIDRVYQYLKYTNNKAFLEKIWKTLQLIILGYIKGTDFGIKMDEDFLISHDPGLTWMDVKIDDYYPTPRARKAVEIQALWYNALRIMSNIAQLLGKNDKYSDLSEKVKDSFNYQFDDFYDVIDVKDTSLRPNQIFLVSLDFTMIEKQLQKKIVDNVQKNLLTIFGLRTLSPNDSSYRGTYLGNYNKDIAYHNGTVWPWLIGPFIKAFVKVKNHNKKSREYAFENFLKPMLNVYGDEWDGSIFEIFDGDPIYAPRGCITQAWSVAEILRAWIEDIEKITPKYVTIFTSSEISV